MTRAVVTTTAFPVRGAIAALLCSQLCVLMAGCGQSDPQSSEEQIRAAIALAEEAAQQRDMGTLKEFVAGHYKDERGYDKRSVIRLVQGYLLRHRNIHLLHKITDLELIEPGRASTSLLVAMAGRRIESAEQLWELRADVFQFDMLWIRSGVKWRVESATWRRARIDDFLPD